MKQITVKLNLTKQELATIAQIGLMPRDYVTSIVHYDLRKILPADIQDSIPYEQTPDKNYL